MDAEHAPYMRGFVHGMHFLLLALDGRLRAAASRAEVQALLAEYYELIDDHRDRLEAPEATRVALRYEDDAPVA